VAKKKLVDIHDTARHLKMYRDAYYAGEPLISDAEFDALETLLKETAPNHHYFRLVGSKPTDQDQVVQHKCPMLSMDKVKTADEAPQWLSRINVPLNMLLMAGPKIDGFSVDLSYVNGVISGASTRGDGKEGVMIPFPEEIDGIVERIPYTEESMNVRGEIYISQQVAKYEAALSGKSLRNFASGIARRQKRTDELKYLRFVAYDITRHNALMGGPVSFFHLLEYLRGFMPNVIPAEIVSFSKEEGFRTVKDYLQDYLNKWRNEWDFESDGIVLTINNRTLHKDIDKSRGGATTYHHYNLAIKPPSQRADTKLIDVRWRVSKHGSIIPTAYIEPVMIVVEYSSVTLNNAETVTELGLRVGDTLTIERANDVIPKIVGVVHNEGRPIELPTICPSCRTPLIRDESVHLKCPNKNCDARNIELINHWVEMNNIKNVGSEAISDLYNSGAIRSVADLYTINVEEALSKLDGYVVGGKRIAKINDAIQGSRSLTPTQLIGRLGIPGIGDITAEKLELKSVDDLFAFQKLDSFPYKFEENIHNWLADEVNVKFLNELKSVLWLKAAEPEDPNVLTVCITGKFIIPREEMIIKLNENGFKFVPSVTKETDVLIQGDGKETGGKISAAQKYGVSIVASLEELISKFKS